MNFLDNLQPKYLPNGWSVDHKIFRQFGEFSKFTNTMEDIDLKTNEEID